MKIKESEVFLTMSARKTRKEANNMNEEKKVIETPVEETPVEETPVEETPVEETPVEEIPVSTQLDTLIESMREDMRVDLDKAKAILSVTKKDGTKTDIVKKVYKFIEPVGNKNQLTVMDAETIETLELIKGAIEANKKTTYVICKGFSRLNNKEQLEKMGFKTIGELGKAIYGLETSTVNHYARIGELFIMDDFTINPMLPQLSVSHLLELTSYADGDVEKISELYQNGTLVDGMSTKKIRETLKNLRESTIEDKQTSSSESDNDTTIVADNGTEVITDSESSDSSESSESSESNEPTAESIESLKANFNKEKIVGKLANYCLCVDQCFKILTDHDIEIVGYKEHIDTLKAIVEHLL